jgi:hypothetical protein
LEVLEEPIFVAENNNDEIKVEELRVEDGPETGCDNGF